MGGTPSIHLANNPFYVTAAAAAAADPNFSAPISNVTVPVGREAILTCVVQDLVSYKVSVYGCAIISMYNFLPKT